MSAFVVTPAHIDYLVNAAMRYGRGSSWLRIGALEVWPATATQAGSELLAENIASVRYRYPDCDPNQLPGPIPTPSAVDYRHRVNPTVAITHVGALKALDCYEYQSCEHPEWAGGAVQQFCEQLRRAIIASLPGYDDAPWEIDEPIIPDRSVSLLGSIRPRGR